MVKCKKGYKKVGSKCKKNTSSKGKGAVNVKNMWIYIIVLGVLFFGGLFFYGGNAGWFRDLSVVGDTTIINYLNTPDDGVSDSSCSLSFSPNSIYEGDRTTGTIIDGKNSLCRVFAFDGTNWINIYEGITDANGVLVSTRNIDMVGNFIFRAVCDSNNNGGFDSGDCLTNTEELTVIARTAPTDDCVDSDGYDKMVPGHVTSSIGVFYDKCVDDNSVTEFWCDGGIVTGTLLDCDLGDTCFETRSGGYCQTSPESYDVGDNVGSGSSGSGTSGFGDDDSINVIIMDWTTGGNYILGAKITRSWDYIGEGCMGPEQFPMEWSLYDSNGMAWQSYDYFPVSNVVDYVCPVTYHEDAPWKFVVTTGIQACDVEYSWNVQPYICEILD